MLCLLYLRLRRTIECWLAERALRQLSIRMAVTTEHLQSAEADMHLPQLDATVRRGIQRDVVELRTQKAALADEWLYCSAVRRRLNAGHKGD